VSPFIHRVNQHEHEVGGEAEHCQAVIVHVCPRCRDAHASALRDGHEGRA
jgi:hypothetical protein